MSSGGFDSLKTAHNCRSRRWKGARVYHCCPCRARDICCTVGTIVIDNLLRPKRLNCETDGFCFIARRDHGYNSGWPRRRTGRDSQ